MATHDPLVFSRLERPQVRLFRRGDAGSAVVDTPLHDPRGMGVQAILASDMFRLPGAGLDSETARAVEEQRTLRASESLTLPEQRRLRQLTDYLNSVGYWMHDRDPLYQLFLQKFVPAWMETGGRDVEAPELTVDETRAREELAEEIAEELANEDTRAHQ
jgi:hypothetical protein